MEQNSRVEDIILKKLENIERTQVAHREEFLREITRINTERKTIAGTWGAMWGAITGGIMLMLKFIWEKMIE